MSVYIYIYLSVRVFWPNYWTDFDKWWLYGIVWTLVRSWRARIFELQSRRWQKWPEMVQNGLKLELLAIIYQSTWPILTNDSSMKSLGPKVCWDAPCFWKSDLKRDKMAQNGLKLAWHCDGRQLTFWGLGQLVASLTLLWD